MKICNGLVALTNCSFKNVWQGSKNISVAKYVNCVGKVTS